MSSTSHDQPPNQDRRFLGYEFCSYWSDKVCLWTYRLTCAKQYTPTSLNWSCLVSYTCKVTSNKLIEQRYNFVCLILFTWYNISLYIYNIAANCYRTKIIIHHINVVTKLNSDSLYSSEKYFITITKLYICIVLVNIRYIYVKYSHCGLIHFKIIRGAVA